MKLPDWQRIKNHVLDTPFSQGIPYWAGGLLVGLVAWFYSGSFSKAIETCAEILETHPYWLFIISPSCLVLARWIVERFAPEATGTGIPQVIRALKCETPLEQGTIERTLSSRTALVVMASSILCVLGAGGLGREGPMVHVGACILYVTGRQLSRIWPFEEHRSWIMAGAAAGIAAAFNAPLAGVVFVLEELSQQHFHQFKTVVLSSAIVGGVTSQWLSGRFLFLGYPKVAEIPLSSIPWALGLGLLAGVFAYPFHWMVGPKLDYWFKHYFKTRIQIAFVVGILLAATAIFVSPRSIGGGVGLIQALLFEEGYRADLTTIAGRFLSTTLAHLSGCAGGFLGPALGLGGAIGSWFATITEYPNHNLLVMVGMSAFLSAIIRAPFTAWVIVMEMTDRHSAIFPLMVASLASAAFLSLIEKLAAPTSPNSPPH